MGSFNLNNAVQSFSDTNGASKGAMKIKPIIDLHNQTVEISKEERSRVSKLVGEKGELRQRLFEDAKTLYEGFRRGARESRNGECLGYRPVDADNKAGPYRWLRYDEVIRRSENVARGFLEKGLAVGQSTFVGLYSQNRPEWVIAEQACYHYSMVVVPLYDTLGPDACSYIINQADIQLVIVDKSKKAESLLKKHDQCPALRVLVLLESPEPSMKTQAEALGIQVLTFSELEQLGAAAAERSPSALPPTPADLCTISYTSGTTGMPKGAMLTHGNIVADSTGLAILKYAMVNSNDVMISFLPLAHMFERMLEAVMFTVGARVAFFRGDIKLLTEDIKELRPTIMPVVPRLLNRIYDKVMQEAHKSIVKGFLVDTAIKSKTKDLKKSIVSNTSIWDKIVFKRIREGMGGRVRLMVTGSAPLAEEVLTFIRAAMGCIVLEGYGQTECVAAATVTMEGDHTPGHVGPPIPCCQIKLADVPDMNYFAREGAGEVCIKGYNVFQGYYKDPEKTAEALDQDGWLHTGDIGRWTPEGTIKLVDRKKHIFKLAQGEYIAPEKIENVYLRSRFIGQVYVHGESLKSCLVAIVSPDPEVLPQFAEKEFGLTATMAELCNNEKIKKLILDDMMAEGKKGGLHSFEQIKDIHLYPEAFTIEAGLLTPTLKAKRAAIKDYFKEQLERMYRHLD